MADRYADVGEQQDAGQIIGQVSGPLSWAEDGPLLGSLDRRNGTPLRPVSDLPEASSKR